VTDWTIHLLLNPNTTALTVLLGRCNCIGLSAIVRFSSLLAIRRKPLSNIASVCQMLFGV
jgi:hypothetical protein